MLVATRRCIVLSFAIGRSVRRQWRLPQRSARSVFGTRRLAQRQRCRPLEPPSLHQLVNVLPALVTHLGCPGRPSPSQCARPPVLARGSLSVSRARRDYRTDSPLSRESADVPSEPRASVRRRAPSLSRWTDRIPLAVQYVKHQHRSGRPVRLASPRRVARQADPIMSACAGVSRGRRVGA